LVSHTHVGDVLKALGEPADALEHLNSALKTADRLTQVDVTNVQWQRDKAVSNERIGDILKDLERRDEAKAAFERALEIYRGLEARAPDDPNARISSVLPRWRLADLEPERAAEHLRSALSILERLAQEKRLDALRTGWYPQIRAQLAALEV
jgi:tetratricopeptide (TPR) repeat protein